MTVYLALRLTLNPDLDLDPNQALFVNFEFILKPWPFYTPNPPSCTTVLKPVQAGLEFFRIYKTWLANQMSHYESLYEFEQKNHS